METTNQHNDYCEDKRPIVVFVLQYNWGIGDVRSRDMTLETPRP
jgi:hypothetical protein